MIKPTEKRKFKLNKQLTTVLIISAGAHILGGLILGGLTIVKYVIPDEAKFEAPPEIEAEPPEPEVKIEVAPRPAQISSNLNNLKLQEVRNIAVSNLDLNMPNMSDSFTVSVGVSGLGRGGGSLLGGSTGNLQLGLSDVSVFGLKTKAERILFVIDAGGNMAIDAKGGLSSYQVIKDEITTMVSNLSAGTLFNVAVYNRNHIKYFKSQLVAAGSDVSAELNSWIGKVKPSPNKKSLGGSQIKLQTYKESDGKPYITQTNIGWSANRPNENMTLTQNILEQGVDAAFIITGYHAGFEGVWRQSNEREKAKWERETSRKAYKDALAAHEKEKPQMERRIKAELDRINRERAAKGQPPRILNSQWGIYSQVNELKLKWNHPHPGWGPKYNIEPRNLQSYFRELMEVLYSGRDTKKPSLNVVLFLAGDEKLNRDSKRSLKRYAQLFNGKMRVIRGADEIRDARSASTSKN